MPSLFHITVKMAFSLLALAPLFLIAGFLEFQQFPENGIHMRNETGILQQVSRRILRENTSVRWFAFYDVMSNPELGQYYSIYHYNSGKYITVDGHISKDDDSNIIIYPWCGVGWQMWRFELHPWGVEHKLPVKLLRIRNKDPGKCITIRQTKNEHDGREMYQSECRDDDLNQAFEITHGAWAGYFALGLYRHEDSTERCWSVERWLTADATKLVDWGCSTDAWNQNFYLGGI